MREAHGQHLGILERQLLDRFARHVHAR
jgi:hypothetical protein